MLVVRRSDLGPTLPLSLIWSANLGWITKHRAKFIYYSLWGRVHLHYLISCILSAAPTNPAAAMWTLSMVFIFFTALFFPCITYTFFFFLFIGRISYPTNYDRVNCIAIRNWPECSFRVVRKLDRSMPCEVTRVIS